MQKNEALDREKRPPRKSILLTGGAGYIGAHSAMLLNQAGFELLVIDNLITGRRENARWGQFVEGDISDTSLVRRLLREYRISAVLHLAASAHVGESVKAPELYFRNNVGASINLIESMLREGVHHLVFASSSSVYGNAGTSKMKEQEVPVPMSPYGESKLQTEKMLRWHAKANGLRWTALRYFNVAGATDGLGEDIQTSSRIFPRAVAAAVSKREPVQVFGTDFPTVDGSAVRDYVHVRDVAQANVLAIQHVLGGLSGDVINIASGHGASVLQIMKAVETAVGAPVPHILSTKREGDPACAVGDNSRARGILGWTPACSSLQDIASSIVPMN